MNWPIYQKQFESYLQLEKSLSGNSVEAYLNDLGKLRSFLDATNQHVDPAAVTTKHLQGFLEWVNALGMSATTQARILSGIRAFYKFLIMENLVTADPTELIEAPKLRRKLPDTLNFQEIEQLFAAIDVSKPEGARNKAMLETLYSSGLRVTELIELKLSNFYPDLGFLKVTGKGNKERLVPVGRDALKYIQIYLEHFRKDLKIKKGQEDFLFLNRRGAKLTRVMVFLIIKAAI